MVDKILESIGRHYLLTKKDAGEFSNATVGPMDFQMEYYEAEGLGNVSVMTGSAMGGMMKMDTVIVNPFDRDESLFSYDRIYAMGNDTLFLEIFDTRLDKTVSEADIKKSLSELTSAYQDLPDEPVASKWYDEIRLPESICKKSKAEDTPRLDELTDRYIDIYLKFCAQAPSCDPEAKKKAARIYTEGLLTNGGASTDPFIQAKGIDFTSKLFRTMLFGTGDPD